MINSKKKGFTIVELVIVIAVVAILAAVLIPTFSNLVKKANLSNDQSMVRNMNTTLALESVLEDGFENAGEAIDALNRNGFSGKYNTFSSKFHYCYSLENNKMYLVNDKNEVIYPEESTVSLSSLWGLYMDERTSFINGVTKYVALENIMNSQHYVEIFENGTYVIDLNDHLIAVENNSLDVTVINGVVISGAQKGEGASDDYIMVSDVTANKTNLDAYATITETEYKLSKLIFTSDKIISSDNKKSINPYFADKKIVFEDCIFYDVNMSINDSSKRPNTKIEINNCKFIDISGGWAILGYSSMKITNCEFINLTSRGGIQVHDDNENIDIEIANCTFNGTAGVYPLIRFVGPHGTNVGNISSLKIENCEFTTLNKGKGILGFSGTGSSLYNYIGSVDGPTVTFTNNKVGDDITSDEYVVDAGTNNKLADLFAKSVK